MAIMGTAQSLLLLWLSLCGRVCIADSSFMVPSHRELGHSAAVNALSDIRKRQSGSNPASLAKVLYWFGNFSVGDSGPLTLLLDSGSSDLLVDPGLYKPSKSVQPYPNQNFSITYEGVNRKGFGFETINGTVTLDVVTAAGLTIKNQSVGDIKSFKYKDAPQAHKAVQGQGIIGFLDSSSSSFNPGAPSWAFNLCYQKLLSQCKFALAFGTSGKGLTILGKVAKTLFKGELTTAPRVTKPFSAWIVQGDVAISDKIVFKNQTLIMDSGTDNIQAPIAVAKKIFHMLGYQMVERNGGPNPFNPSQDLKTLIAYFPCNKPPNLGFSIPAESDMAIANSATTSTKSKLFDVSPLEWGVYNHGNNNCTSILGGTNALADPGYSIWLIGQPFFSGHYVNFDISGGTMGFADLKNPADPSSSS